jgi:hypothetical protein
MSTNEANKKVLVLVSDLREYLRQVDFGIAKFSTDALDSDQANFVVNGVHTATLQEWANEIQSVIGVCTKQFGAIHFSLVKINASGSPCFHVAELEHLRSEAVKALSMQITKSLDAPAKQKVVETTWHSYQAETDAVASCRKSVLSPSKSVWRCISQTDQPLRIGAPMHEQIDAEEFIERFNRRLREVPRLDNVIKLFYDCTFACGKDDKELYTVLGAAMFVEPPKLIQV